MSVSQEVKDSKVLFTEWSSSLSDTDVFSKTDADLNKELLTFVRKRKADEIAQITGEDIQKLALNGIQIESLLSIIQNVVAGVLPSESAKLIIKQSFPSFDEKSVDEIIANIKVNPYVLNNTVVKK